MPFVYTQALSGMGHVWRKVHTVWVNIGGLHAAVYLLKRTSQAFVHPSEQDKELLGNEYKNDE